MIDMTGIENQHDLLSSSARQRRAADDILQTLSEKSHPPTSGEPRGTA